jgi:hypothetical protein
MPGRRFGMDERRNGHSEDTLALDEAADFPRDPFADDVAEVAWEWANDPDQGIPW